MGRNPVVGRQGPRHHAATVPAESEAKTIAVTQIRSAIGHADTMRRTPGLPSTCKPFGP